MAACVRCASVSLQARPLRHRHELTRALRCEARRPTPREDARGYSPSWHALWRGVIGWAHTQVVVAKGLGRALGRMTGQRGWCARNGASGVEAAARSVAGLPAWRSRAPG